MKTDPSITPDTCEHAFLIKQKIPADEEIVVYLIPTDAESSEAASGSADGLAGGGRSSGAGNAAADKKKHK